MAFIYSSSMTALMLSFWIFFLENVVEDYSVYLEKSGIFLTNRLK